MRAEASKGEAYDFLKMGLIISDTLPGEYFLNFGRVSMCAIPTSPNFIKSAKRNYIVYRSNIEKQYCIELIIYLFQQFFSFPFVPFNFDYGDR